MNVLDQVRSRAPAGLSAAPPGAVANVAAPKSAFADLLRDKIDGAGCVRFSAHAQQRLDSRSIRFSPGDKARIAQAVDQAAAKGSRESLLVMSNVALVVSVPNRTVITAMGTNEAANTVFTNIDSAVVVPNSPASPSHEPHSGPDPFRGSPSAADRPMRQTATE